MKTRLQQFFALKKSLSGRELTPNDFTAIKSLLSGVRRETKHPMFGISSDSLVDEVVSRANYWLSVKAECPESKTANTPMVDYIRQVLVEDSFFGWSGYLSQVEKILGGCVLTCGRYTAPRHP